MDAWLEWARGPVFLFSFTFMFLGLIRHVGLTAWAMVRTMRQAGDKTIPYAQVLSATLKWLIPVDKVRSQILFSLTSLLFHIAILIVPLFLAGHIVLWTRGLGLSWPAIPNNVADVLTIVAIVTAVALVIQRATAPATRSLSRFQDYALPLLVALPFASGYFVMHPSGNPFSYEATLFVHAMSANVLFVLIPLTKLSHMAFFPSVQMVSEIAWRWPSDSGSKVGLALGKENEAI
jgi:nitrate reductase gamma subunit